MENEKPQNHTVTNAGDLPRGTTLERYVVLEKVGQGAVGTVYAAYDSKLGRNIALKILRSDVHAETAKDFKHRIMREAQAMAKLNNPNVNVVHDVGEFDGQPYVAMEFVEGWTVRQWLNEKPRSWKDVVEVFLQAGRGIQAAHAAGLLHRDIKPDNILIGKDGRIRVTDFGLVAASAKHLETGATQGAPSDQAMGAIPDEALAFSLTRTGDLVGSPAYMAPEQYQRQPTTTKSDQFSFCVSLYEALYGERPFAGQTVLELHENVTQGRVVEEPAGSHVPIWLREVILRGLRAPPQERFASMAELLEALGKDPAKSRRRRIVGAAGLIVIAAMLFGAWWLGRGESQLCKGAEAHWQGVWDADSKATLKKTFIESGRHYAQDTYRRLERLLDQYAARWVKQRVDACEATHFHGEQSDQLLYLRMRCLDRHLRQAAALIAVFVEKPSAEVVDQAVEAASKLPNLALCADEEYLAAEIPPPEDLETRKEVESIRRQIDRAKAFEDSGKYKEGLEVARSAVRRAERTDYRPVRAEAMYQLGTLLNSLGDYKESESALEKAAKSAEEDGNAILLVRVLIDKIDVATSQARYEEGLALRRLAEQALHFAERNHELQADLLNNLGSVLAGRGEYQQARKLYKRALAIDEEIIGPEHPDMASTLNNLCFVLFYQGEYQEARRNCERALAIKVKAVGPEHPKVANSANNLGAVLQEQGEYQEARKLYERALAIRVKALGTEHLSVAHSLGGLGKLLRIQGEYQRAREYHERTLSIIEKALGPEHPEVAFGLQNLGGALLDQGNDREARKHFERALAIREKTLGPEHPDVAASVDGLGMVFMAQGNDREARKHFERALAIREKTLGPEHPDLTCSDAGLGLIDLRQGQLDRAISRFERVLAICGKNKCGITHRSYLSTVQLGLAKALWNAGKDRKRSIELAKKALERFKQQHSVQAKKHLLDASAWLKRRGINVDVEVANQVD